MRLVAVGLIAVVLTVFGFATAAFAGKRVALIIGNSAYVSVGALSNPKNDAASLAATLREIGFDQVDELNDLDQTAFRKALRKFTSAAQGADTAVVYYAGHGVEVDGRNYLVPVDAELAQATDAEFEAIPLDNVRTAVSGASKLRLVILDACRNNPFKLVSTDGKRSIGRGLARVEPGANEVIAYAAREGTVASDGSGEANSPYAKSLVKYLKQPGLEIRLLFGQVRDEVLAATGQQQEPFIYGTLGGQPIVLNAAAAAEPAEQAVVKKAAEPVVASASSEAANAWVAVKDTTSIGVLKAYIAKFQGTVFADMASARLEELQPAAKPVEQPAEKPAETAMPKDTEVAAVDPVVAPAETTEDQVAGGVLTPSAVLPVGKWAEGAAVVGDKLWVSESGERTIVAVDPRPGMGVQQTVKVGRLPVGLEAGPDGKAVFSLQHTDKTLWMQPVNGGKGQIVAKFDECPQDLAIGQAAAWVLTWPDCSSNDSRLIRVLKTGRREQTGLLGGWGEAVALGHGSAWVAHPSGGFVSRVDLKSLAVDRVELGDFSGWEIVDAGSVVLAGGRAGDDNTRGLVVAIDPASGLEIARIEVAEMVQRIAVDGDRAYAIGLDGRMFVLAIGGLKLIGDYTNEFGKYRPSDALIATIGGAHTLIVIAQQLNGENGAVIQFSPPPGP